jgi:hypothetical protein
LRWGWTELDNGALLKAAEAEPTIRAHEAQIVAAVSVLRPGDFVELSFG